MFACSDSTRSHVHVIQKYFAGLTPVSLELSNSEVVQLAVRKLAEQLAESDEQVAGAVASYPHAQEFRSRSAR